MSTSLLYHGSGIRGYEYVRTQYRGVEVVFTMRQEPKTFRCEACGVVRQVEVSFADPRRTSTKSFERYALGFSRCMTILDGARHLGASWDVVKDIQKRDLSRRCAKPKLAAGVPQGRLRAEEGPQGVTLAPPESPPEPRPRA